MEAEGGAGGQRQGARPGDDDGRRPSALVRAVGPVLPSGMPIVLEALGRVLALVGDVVLGGSFTRPTAAVRGDVFHVDYGRLGAIAFRFA